MTLGHARSCSDSSNDQSFHSIIMLFDSSTHTICPLGSGQQTKCWTELYCLHREIHAHTERLLELAARNSLKRHIAWTFQAVSKVIITLFWGTQHSHTLVLTGGSKYSAPRLWKTLYPCLHIDQPCETRAVFRRKLCLIACPPTLIHTPTEAFKETMSAYGV